MKSKRVIATRIVLSILSVLMIGFIFLNSSFDAMTSDAQSFSVREFLNSVLHSLNLSIVLSDHFVRKCAHFVEYFVLGTLLFFTVKLYLSKNSVKIFSAVAIGLAVAIVDESIQLFSVGRSAQFSDVLLDFFSVCTAVTMLYFAVKMKIKR
ncbi:MAG: VanZ family protein [Ruminococcaceae bacterium]|nr:VanZ family protein [Oscillospiraceae bacterium]